MNIDITDANLKAIVAEAILANISGEKRDAVMKEAIAFLLVPEKNDYGSVRRPAPIEQAFRDAAAQIAKEEARKMLDSNSEFQTKLKELLVEGVAAMFEGGRREKTVKTISDALERAFCGDRY